jgi:hypothetical protein
MVLDRKCDAILMVVVEGSEEAIKMTKDSRD